MPALTLRDMFLWGAKLQVLIWSLLMRVSLCLYVLLLSSNGCLHLDSSLSLAKFGQHIYLLDCVTVQVAVGKSSSDELGRNS
jgi:hypothetical protein